VLSRARKEEQVAEFRGKFSRATSVYLADFRGIDVQAANELRRRIRNEGKGEFEYRVAKNSVLRLACADSDVARIAEHFDGPTALALSYGDPVGLAKILVDFSKEHGAFELKAGLIESDPVDQGEIARLATLPSLDGLRGQIIGLLQAPAVKLVRLVSEPGAQIARVLAARGREATEE
jgi:large subunit ribosomal protein L10